MINYSSSQRVVIQRYDSKLFHEEGDFFMIKELLEQQIFMYAMLGLCIAGSISKLTLSVVYGNLVKASLHMPETGNRLFKLMRLKFEACYKLKISVHNAENFVDRYLVNHKFCGLFLQTWRKFGFQMTFLCVCVGMSGAVLGMMEECSRRLILEHAGMGLLTGAFLYLLDGLCAFDLKSAQMKANAVDFFDNFLRSRLENEYFHPEEMKEYCQAFFEKEPEEHAAASRELTAEEAGVKMETGNSPKPEPVPAKRKRKPEMFTPPAEEMAAGRESAKTVRNRRTEGNRSDQEMLERSMEEVEKEKIIEDILKEYLV